MKALLLNGARAGETHIDAIASQIDERLRHTGWETHLYTLRDERIRSCLGCFDCWVKTPGECVIKDINREISALTMQSDLLLMVTPVVFGGYSSELKKMLDHQIPLVMPFFQRIDGEIHHEKRYQQYPAFVGIGVQAAPNPEQARIFSALVGRNAINMHAPYHSGDVWLADTPPHVVHTRTDRILNSILEVAS